MHKSLSYPPGQMVLCTSPLPSLGRWYGIVYTDVLLGKLLVVCF